MALFFGIGLGLFGKVSHATTLLLATSVFVAQVPLSAWSLRRCAYGPLEWLWRQFTYRRRIPLVRAAGERALPPTQP